MIDDPYGVRVFCHELAHLSTYRLVLGTNEALEPGTYVAHFVTQHGSGGVQFSVPDTPFNPLSESWGSTDAAGPGVELVYRGSVILPAGQTDVTFTVPPVLCSPAGHLAWRSALALRPTALSNGWKLTCAQAPAQDSEIFWIAY